MKALIRSRYQWMMVLFVACIANGDWASAGKLGAVREAVRSEKQTESKKEKPKRDRSRRDRRRDCDDGDSFNWISIFVSDSDSPASTPSYSPSTVGQEYSATATSITQTLDQSHWCNRFTGFWGTDSETLKHGSFQWLAQVPGSLGLDVGGARFRERIGSTKDHLWIGDANIVFEPILGAVRGRLGIGLNWLHDSAGFEMGTNFTAGFDWTLMDFIVTSGEVDFGSLGEASMFHAQVTVGLQLGPTEVFTGYNKYDIGGVDLDGTVVGMRLRF